MKSTAAAYRTEILAAGPERIAAYVHGGARPYGVTLTPAMVACGCPDHMYRNHVCKHMRHVAAHLQRQFRALLDAEVPAKWTDVQEASDNAVRANDWIEAAERAEQSRQRAA